MGMNWAMGAYAAWAGSPTGQGIIGLNAASGDTLPTADFPDGTLDMAMSSTMHPADPAFNTLLKTHLVLLPLWASALQKPCFLM